MLARYGLRQVRWLPTLLVLLPWLLMPLAPSSEARLRELTGAVSFRFLDWESVNLRERAGRLWSALNGQPSADISDADILRSYFGDRTQSEAQQPQVERAMERLVTQAFETAGVTRSMPLPFDRLFPPVLVALTAPPNVLVVSPRSELRVTDTVVLQGLTVAEQERLEASADSTGVSSLVAPIGGLATYPAMVLDDASPERVLSSVAHEWVHHYLIFYPLGARYWSSQEAREINETTADLLAAEVGRRLTLGLDLPAPRRAAATTTEGFDFRGFMRATRLETEQLLAAGHFEQAERFMEARRLELEVHGYRIRRLNQAYFALYGSYGDGFAASPRNPIPGLLRQLRERSDSLADFLFRVRTITSVAELRAAVG